MGLRAQAQPVIHGDDDPVRHRAQRCPDQGNTGVVRLHRGHLLGGGLAGGQVEVGRRRGFFFLRGRIYPPVGQGGVIVGARVDHAVLDVIMGQILVVAAAKGKLQHFHARERAVRQQLPHAGH